MANDDAKVNKTQRISAKIDRFRRLLIKRQTSDTPSDNEWQLMTMSDNEWQLMTTSDNEWYNEWQRIATSDNEWCNKFIYLFILFSTVFKVGLS